MELSNYELTVLDMIEREVDMWIKSTNHQSNPSRANIVGVLEKTLPRIIPNKTFHVSISDSSRDPFVMAIYPDIKELDRKSKELTEIISNPKTETAKYIKAWLGITKWVLEIDIRILLKGGPICVRSGSEFVAILCHEIGHVMAEDPFELVYNYQKRKATLDRFNKMAAMKIKFVRKLMMPMFINTLSFRIVRHRNQKDSLRKELIADGYVPEKYRECLISYIEEVILTNPEASNLVSSFQDYRNEQELSVKFSEDALSMLRDRTEVLKNQFTAQYNGCTGSEYHKKLISFISHSIMSYDPKEEKTNLMMENMLHNRLNDEIAVCEQCAQAAIESTQCTERDLAILEVQCGNVKTTEDKIYLIHTIYDFIESIQKEHEQKRKKTKNSSVIEKLIQSDNRLSRLEKCRSILMSKNTTEIGDRYGVFVKYPEGYEG